MDKYFIAVLNLIVCLLSSACAQADSTTVIIDSSTQCVLETVQKRQWTRMQGILEDKNPPQRYQLFKFGQLTGSVDASAPKPEQGPEDGDIYYRVRFKEKVEPGLIAVGNLDWEPSPRKVITLNTQHQLYQRMVRRLLDQKGLTQTKVKITQLFKVDLEGDGVDEVFISATYIGPKTNQAQPPSVDKHGRPLYAGEGDYSFVQLRRVVNGQLVTDLLDEDFHLPRSDEEKLIPPLEPRTYTIAAIMDLNGDGRMEIVIRCDYFETRTIYICEIAGNRIIAHPDITTLTVPAENVSGVLQ